MDEARERSRNVQSKAYKHFLMRGPEIAMDANASAALHNMGVPTTDDNSKFIWFQDHESTVRAIYSGVKFLDHAKDGDEIGIILESTSFYAEQGGQIYDTGSIECHTGSFEVCDVQLNGGFALHVGSFSGQSGSLTVGDKVVCKVDYARRQLIAPNHTCTHMLNFALRQVLGNHIEQKGSIVLPEKLRFDFSHGKPVGIEELRKIEDIVNDQIKAELDVYAMEATLSDAKSIKGLRAVVGEIYPDPVRVVSIGKTIGDMLAVPENEEWQSYSVELCGGTHISNTREAKAFALISEEGIAKGVRRLTALTAQCAFDAIELAQSLEKKVLDASNIDENELEKKLASLKNDVDKAVIPTLMKNNIRAKISLLLEQIYKLRKNLAQENRKKAVKAVSEEAEAAILNGKSFCVSLIDVGMDAKAAKEAVQSVVQHKGISAMVLSTDESAKKVMVYAGVPDKGNTWKGLDV